MLFCHVFVLARAELFKATLSEVTQRCDKINGKRIGVGRRRERERAKERKRKTEGKSVKSHWRSKIAPLKTRICDPIPSFNVWNKYQIIAHVCCYQPLRAFERFRGPVLRSIFLHERVSSLLVTKVISNLQLEKSLVCDVTKDSDDGFLPVRTRGSSNKGAF